MHIPVDDTTLFVEGSETLSQTPGLQPLFNVSVGGYTSPRVGKTTQGPRSNVGTVLAHLVPTPLQGGVGTCQQHAQEVLAHGVLTAGSRGVRTHW